MGKLYFGDGTSISIGDSEKNKRIVPWICTQHRGCSINVPEETIPSFYESMLNGCDGFEVDVQSTSDGVMVLTHSNPITDINETEYSVSGSTYETLKGAVLQSDTTYGDITIATLEEALDFCYYHGKFLVMDSIGNATEATNIANLVVDRGMSGKCIYMLVFHTDDVTEISQAILAVDSRAKIAIDYAEGLTSTTYDNLTTNKDQILILMKKALITDTAISEIKASGYPMYFWDFNSSDSVATYAKYKPDYWQYESDQIPSELNSAYIDTLDFGKGIS